MKILITGVDGFVGSNLQSALLAGGYMVTGTTFRRPAGEGEFDIDITSQDPFSHLPDTNFDIIIHTIGAVDQTLPRKRLMDTNAKGTRKILQWAKSHGCWHFIQMSSVSVLGMRTLGQNHHDNQSKPARWFTFSYGLSKARAESHVISSGLAFSILRMPALLGRNDSYFSRVISEALCHDHLYVSGDGSRRVSILYIHELCRVIARLIKVAPTNEILNCCSHHPPWQKLIDIYAFRMGLQANYRKKSLAHLLISRNKDLAMLLTFSKFGAYHPSEKIWRLLDLTPKYSLDEVVQDATSV